MKRILLLIVVMACSVQLFAQSGRRVANTRTPPVQPPVNPEPARPEPPPLPPATNLRFIPERLLDRKIKTLDQSSFRLADFQGKVMVINLWASWCGPCRREVPEYETVRQQYSGKNVEFIGLTVDDQDAADTVKRFVRDTKFGFLLGWADRDMAQILMNGRRSIPQTIVIGSDGNVINHWVGYAPRSSGNRLRQALDDALR